ncbi:hypothetical protein C2E23DRAFT_559960 [Lenzites betulinus]|nr:hypothetical protein C2E23DRAFT_559960 [Lenzites betulinus]
MMTLLSSRWRHTLNIHSLVLLAARAVPCRGRPRVVAEPRGEIVPGSATDCPPTLSTRARIDSSSWRVGPDRVLYRLTARCSTPAHVSSVPLLRHRCAQEVLHLPSSRSGPTPPLHSISNTQRTGDHPTHGDRRISPGSFELRYAANVHAPERAPWPARFPSPASSHSSSITFPVHIIPTRKRNIGTRGVLPRSPSSRAHADSAAVLQPEVRPTLPREARGVSVYGRHPVIAERSTEDRCSPSPPLRPLPRGPQAQGPRTSPSQPLAQLPY